MGCCPSDQLHSSAQLDQWRVVGHFPIWPTAPTPANLLLALGLKRKEERKKIKKKRQKITKKDRNGMNISNKKTTEKKEIEERKRERERSARKR